MTTRIPLLVVWVLMLGVSGPRAAAQPAEDGPQGDVVFARETMITRAQIRVIRHPAPAATQPLASFPPHRNVRLADLSVWVKASGDRWREVGQLFEEVHPGGSPDWRLQVLDAVHFDGVTLLLLRNFGGLTVLRLVAGDQTAVRIPGLSESEAPPAQFAAGHFVGRHLNGLRVAIYNTAGNGDWPATTLPLAPLFEGRKAATGK